MAHADTTVNNYQVHPQSLATWRAVTTAAKTTYGDAANAVLLGKTGAKGGDLVGLSAVPRATVTATQLQVYLSPDDGVTMHLLTTELLAAYTMTQTSQAKPTPIKNPDSGAALSPDAPYPLGPNVSVYVAQGVALAGGIAWTGQVRGY